MAPMIKHLPQFHGATIRIGPPRYDSPMTRLLIGWAFHPGRWMTPIHGGHWDWGAAGGPNQAPLLLGEI
jgi:hypothetical protein